MKIYVVMQHWDYEGDDVIEVHLTQKGADAACKQIYENDVYGSRATYFVREFEVKE